MTTRQKSDALAAIQHYHALAVPPPDPVACSKCGAAGEALRQDCAAPPLEPATPYSDMMEECWPNALLTVSEVAARLDSSEEAVRQWCRQGRLPGARRIGWAWLIPAESLEAFQPPARGGYRPRRSKPA